MPFTVSPDNVQKTGVSPGGQSGSPIVAAEGEQVERTRGKTWSGARSEGFCALQALPFRALLPSRKKFNVRDKSS